MKFKRTELKRGLGLYQPDWEADNMWVEVKVNPRGITAVREGLLHLTYALAEQPGLRAFLLLIDPYMTELRIKDEWRKMQLTFRSDITKRLSIVIFENGAISCVSKEPEPGIREGLADICKQELSDRKTPLSRPDFKSEILKILICQWLNRKGPLTLDWLGNAAGCNYRTVVIALEELGNALARRSDRSVELKYFPKDAWERLLVNSSRSRLTKRYSDRSGQPRSIESLLKRLAGMQLENVAVAGILGARHYYPEIDLIGTPRLDLTVHCPEKYPDIDFIGRLDPALEQEDDRGKPASVVLHFIRRETPFFETNTGGISWADPVECLLDLHEMRLESQALEFLNALQSRGTPQ